MVTIDNQRQARSERADGRVSSTERDPIRPTQKPQKVICKYGKWPPATSIECQHKKGWVMEASNLPRRELMVNTRSLIDKLRKPKIVFTLSSSGYCAIHWLVSHNFSTSVFSRALVFGAIAAMAVVWLSRFAQKHRATSFAGEHSANE